jgi:DNA-binding response OmpR family regulator
MREKRILIVEDNADLRRLFRTALSLAGYEVEEAGDGLEALHQIENRPPDLVVLDLVLRSLDGMSVQQELAARTLTSRIPIVIVTGSDIDPSTLDVACVLRKPVMPDELVSTVKRCLRRRAGQRRVASSSHRSSRGRNDLYALRV